MVSPTFDVDIDAISRRFLVANDQLKLIMRNYGEALVEGLSRPDSMLKCLPTFVTKLPSGKEKGKFILVDLGGTNLRVALGVLEGDHAYKLFTKTTIISEELKGGSGFELFKFIAEEIHVFTQSEPRCASVDSVGFTFSFPVEQQSICRGKIIQFNKSFNCKDIVGLDAVDLLQRFLDELDLNLTVRVLVNDTIGTFAAHAYKNSATRLACILGTGTNGCYWEQKEKISKLGEQAADMLINIEWGGFGDGKEVGLPRNIYDDLLMKESEAKEKQALEKMVSGMYLGELFRLAIAGTGLLKDNIEAYHLDTKSIANFSKDSMLEFLTLEAFTNELVFEKLYSLANNILKRSAKLSAALIAATYLHSTKDLKPQSFVVAIDGSLYSNNFVYQQDILLTLGALLEPQDNSAIRLETSMGEPLMGSGIIIAALDN